MKKCLVALVLCLTMCLVTGSSKAYANEVYDISEYVQSAESMGYNMADYPYYVVCLDSNGYVNVLFSMYEIVAEYDTELYLILTSLNGGGADNILKVSSIPNSGSFMSDWDPIFYKIGDTIILDSNQDIYYEDELLYSPDTGSDEDSEEPPHGEDVVGGDVNVVIDYDDEFYRNAIYIIIFLLGVSVLCQFTKR